MGGRREQGRVMKGGSRKRGKREGKEGRGRRRMKMKGRGREKGRGGGSVLA